ncbi:MAG: sulfide/dihydroorotate dehydrogenase-like FAD/NAD-binding protein [Elusimicrobia bacterium]|nr:sulfide/dihydroorotate dehydrogenase-like FAD/NAD-binding protein [Elusimicrobiota bacterium]
MSSVNQAKVNPEHKHKTPTVKLTIDGRVVAAKKGQTVLDCAGENGILIPHLCSHPVLPPFGACRLCLVEIEGMRGYPTSCSTPAEEGMVVRTGTEALKNLQRNILSLIILEHPGACLLCEKRQICDEFRPDAEKAGSATGCHSCGSRDSCEVRRLAENLGIKELPVAPVYLNRPIEKTHPFIDHDPNLCILCGRCVRICKHQHKTSVIDFTDRSSRTRIGRAFDCSLIEAGCTFCGSCVDVCPTGALAERYAKWQPAPDKSVKSTCTFCDWACELEFGIKQDKLICTKSANENIPVCALGKFALAEFLNGSGRLHSCYVRTDGILRETDWQEALAAVKDRLWNYRGDKFAFICDSTGTLEDRFIFRKFTRDVMQSPNYIELEGADQAFKRAAVPAGVKAAFISGGCIEADSLSKLEVLIIQDCYPSEASGRADVVLPVRVLAETEGTIKDRFGRHRPLLKACEPPKAAGSEWMIICRLAKTFGAEGFNYEFVADITKQLNPPPAPPEIQTGQTPGPAQDLKQMRTHFRGHRIDGHVGGLRELNAGPEPAPVSMPAQTKGTFEILDNRRLVPNTHEIVIRAPQVASKAQPGQFVIVMVDEKSERVPYTLCDWNIQTGTITIVVQEKGLSSRKLILCKPGSKLAHVIGPLGVPLEIKKYGTVALAAGCYGIAAIIPVARALKNAGNTVLAVTEARTGYLLYYGDRLRELSDEHVQAAIDGSLSPRGHAVDVIAGRLKSGEKIDCVIAIGCPFMMMLTARETKPYGVKTLAALNPIMLDGTGMCGACRLTVDGKMKFACVDGPFFDAHLIDWDELKDRRRAYSAEEIHSLAATAPAERSHTCARPINR